MRTRYFALILGIVFLAIGILGFVPGLRTAPQDMPALALEGQYGLLFGLFPVNWLHNALHIVFGLWGVIAYRGFSAARAYAVSVAIIYAVLAVMGFFPGLGTLFGLAPLYGNDIWLHAAIAVVAAIFATMRTARTTSTDYGVRR